MTIRHSGKHWKTHLKIGILLQISIITVADNTIETEKEGISSTEINETIIEDTDYWYKKYMKQDKYILFSTYLFLLRFLEWY